MQLVAYGAQDVYLTGNPKVTFFQAVYKRHTNFAMENIEQTVNGSASNSGRISVTVARNGDLIGDMYMQLTTKNTLVTEDGNGSPSGIWAAERAVTDIELSIGGQRIDKHYQLWWRLYSELYLDSAKKANYAKMTSVATASSDLGQVFLPLIFFFNRNPGLYLPLIALQYHEVRLDFDLSSVYDSYFSAAPRVWGNYVYLDTEERRRFAQKGHEYLIEQVQHTGADSVSTGSTSQVRLSYNHPVKELVWCYTRSSGTLLSGLWNFTTGVSAEGLSNVILESNTLAVSIGTNTGNVCAVPIQFASGSPLILIGGGLNPSNIYCSTSAWVEEGSAVQFRSAGPLDSFKLILNGQDRFKEQSGKFFNQVQPFWHHSGCPYPGVYSYSFALKPEEHQPTGTCNFSRIDNAQVQVALKSGAPNTSQWMFAVNYNVLRIQSGMGGLAFSN
jgi:hypothetical protein